MGEGLSSGKHNDRGFFCFVLHSYKVEMKCFKYIYVPIYIYINIAKKLGLDRESQKGLFKSIGAHGSF